VASSSSRESVDPRGREHLHQNLLLRLSRPRAASWLGAGSARPGPGPTPQNSPADINVGRLRSDLTEHIEIIRECRQQNVNIPH
jgi:hypothetical protein